MSNAKKQQDSPVFKWVFTWFPEEGDQVGPKVQQIYDTYGKKLIAQEEKCPETGRIHVQGAIWLNNKKRLTGMKKILPKAHWEHMHSETGSAAYCLKEESRCGSQWILGVMAPIRDPLAGKILYPWQQQIIDIVNTEPDDRAVYWVYDPLGCSGKTALCKHLVLKYNAALVGGCAKDAFYSIATRIKERKNTPIVIFNIARCVDDARHLSYASIEGIKDGLLYSAKYESQECVFNPPHLIIMANFEPIYDNLTRDRWHIIRPTENGEAGPP